MNERNQDMLKLQTISGGSEDTGDNRQSVESLLDAMLTGEKERSTEEKMSEKDKAKTSIRAAMSGLLGSNERESITIHMESRSHNERFARVVAAVFMTRLDPTVEEVEDVKTAVSEAVTNSIIHGYEEVMGIIEMKMSIEGNQLTIVIKDEGKGIPDIGKAMEPLFTTKPAADRSGMGFSFMEAFMDQLEVTSHVGKGTTVTMKKNIGKFTR